MGCIALLTYHPFRVVCMPLRLCIFGLYGAIQMLLLLLLLLSQCGFYFIFLNLITSNTAGSVTCFVEIEYCYLLAWHVAGIADLARQLEALNFLILLLPDVNRNSLQV